jgi:type VI secretion system secreted protein VgrG
VYNGDNKPPYALPDNKTQSGLKSDSTKGHNGYNEFMFEDKKGHELIRMHAQKDHEVTVENSEKWTIGRDRTTTVEGDDTLTIKNGDFNAEVHGKHYTHAKDRITVTSTKEVSHSVNFAAGSFQTLTMTKITMMAPGQVEIIAPLVTIVGNVVVTGGMMVGGRPV